MRITRHEQPDSPEDPGYGVIEFEARLWRDVVLGILGDDDLSTGARVRWAEGTRPGYSRHVRFVACDDDGQPLGAGLLQLPERDNRHLADVSVVVDPGARRRGVGAVIHDALLSAAQAEGRRTVHSFTWEPLVPTGERRLSGAHGDGAIDPEEPSARFLLRRGYRLLQVETMSALDLPGQDRLDADAVAARDSTPAEYETVQWRGVTPAHLRADLAHLMVAMSTDVPVGGADVEPSAVDEERVRTGDERFLDGGMDLLFTAVRHLPSGRLVAFTRLVREAGRDVAGQWETLVLREHRGHGLGWFAKTHNHAVVRSAWPDLRRLITGNASENQYMLAINRRLGYRPIAASGWFELRMDD